MKSLKYSHGYVMVKLPTAPAKPHRRSKPKRRSKSRTLRFQIPPILIYLAILLIVLALVCGMAAIVPSILGGL